MNEQQLRDALKLLPVGFEVVKEDLEEIYTQENKGEGGS